MDSRTVVCVLTHDARFDVPLPRLALRLPVAYVGAMGSRRTHEDRNRRLREAGVSERDLARLRPAVPHGCQSARGMSRFSRPRSPGCPRVVYLRAPRPQSW